MESPDIKPAATVKFTFDFSEAYNVDIFPQLPLGALTIPCSIAQFITSTASVRSSPTHGVA